MTAIKPTHAPRRKPSCFFCECGDHAWGYGTKGIVGLVSLDDAWLLQKFLWTSAKCKSYLHNPAAAKLFGSTFLHRIIMRATKDIEVDHRSTCTFDNRRSNLRLCTHAQNSQNTPLRRNNTSGFKGVSWNKKGGLFEAYISVSGRRISLGRFPTAEQAAEAYAAAAEKHFGEFARHYLTK